MKEIKKYISTNQNVMIHGPGGCGKSYFINNYVIDKLKKYNKSFAITSTTGISAFNINGMTIHRYFGIGIGDKSVVEYVNAIRRNKRTLSNWLKNYIIIDEISMLGKKIFKLINKIAKIIRHNEEPFGGINFILVGDFLQLPPVNDDYIFKSKLFKLLNIRTINLTMPKRYNDIDFFNLLMRLRIANINNNDIKLLKSRVISNIDDNTTILFPLKRQVSSYNMAKYNELKTKEHIFKSVDTANIKTSDNLYKYMEKIMDENVEKEIKLKIGTHVMITANISIDEGLYNGAKGIVRNIIDNAIFVEINNNIHIVNYHTFEYKCDDARFYRKQLPLVYSWSMSIHKSQGLTLDNITVDVGNNIFCDSQIYVAISRVRNIENLNLIGFNPKRINVNNDVLEFLNSAS